MKNGKTSPLMVWIKISRLYLTLPLEFTNSLRNAVKIKIGFPSKSNQRPPAASQKHHEHMSSVSEIAFKRNRLRPVHVKQHAMTWNSRTISYHPLLLSTTAYNRARTPWTSASRPTSFIQPIDSTTTRCRQSSPHQRLGMFTYIV
jgi:hypothetical protein